MRIKCLAQRHYCRCQKIRTRDLTVESPWSYPLSHNSSFPHPTFPSPPPPPLPLVTPAVCDTWMFSSDAAQLSTDFCLNPPHQSEQPNHPISSRQGNFYLQSSVNTAGQKVIPRCHNTDNMVIAALITIFSNPFPHFYYLSNTFSFPNNASPASSFYHLGLRLIPVAEEPIVQISSWVCIS